jgi:hypothetical protein
MTPEIQPKQLLTNGLPVTIQVAPSQDLWSRCSIVELITQTHMRQRCVLQYKSLQYCLDTFDFASATQRIVQLLSSQDNALGERKTQSG